MPNTWSDFAQRSSQSDLEPVIREQFDSMAKIAARLFDVPFARFVLASQGELIVIGDNGPAIGSKDQQQSFFAAVCANLSENEQGLVVPDARIDRRFMNQPIVSGAPHVRFLASVPLFASTGLAMGALCVMDTAPHHGVPDERRQELQTLANAAMACLERWRVAQVRSGVEAIPLPEAQPMSRRFETLADALPQLVWSTRSDGWSDYFSRQWYAFTGALPDTGFGAGWLQFVHPEDVAIASDAWAMAVASGEPYTTEFRLRHADGSYRWMLARGLPVSDEFGRTTRWIGTCTDIDERVRTGDLMEFMSRELSHRIKNLFAVVQGLISMALRNQPGMAKVSRSLQACMVALGRAHDLIRPRIADGSILRSQTTLRQLVETVTLPFVQDYPERLAIMGDDAVVDERAATPLALFFHEMAMNSARFGALSAAEGRLRITIAMADDVTVEWQETGGPTIDHAPQPAFGLGLIRMSIERQLDGSLTMAWLPDGLHVSARIPPNQLSAGQSVG